MMWCRKCRRAAELHVIREGLTEELHVDTNICVIVDEEGAVELLGYEAH